MEFGLDHGIQGVNTLASELLGWSDGFQNPCFMKGYKKQWELAPEKIIYGTGDPDGCKDLIRMFLNIDSDCRFDICGL